MNIEKKDFFISYNSDDEQWAVWIAWQLEATGYSVVIQKWDWGPGNNFILEMQRATDLCDRTIIVLSPEFLKSNYTQPEWAQAFALDPTGEKRLLIPVRVTQCELKGFFKPLVYIDFLESPPANKNDRRDHFKKLLLDGVNLQRKKPLHEPPLPEISEGTTSINALQNEYSKSWSEEDERQVSTKFFGKQREQILQYLVEVWLTGGPAVSILQGFPGSGKTQLAIEVAAKFPRSIDPIEPPPEAADPSADLMTDLAICLDNEGIPDLMDEVDKGKNGDLFKALYKVIKRDRILIIIDEFQRVFNDSSTYPPKKWQILVEKLNNSYRPHGRLMLISNRLIKTSRWCESSNTQILNGLTDQEAEKFFRELLEFRGLTQKVPKSRYGEIGHRLGGNPRAMKTFVSVLVAETLDDLISLAPDLFKPGDVRIDRQLVEDFEHELIERTLSHVEDDLLEFMRWASVHRRPFKKDAFSAFKWEGGNPYILRKQLIDRFLLENTAVGDVMHPLVREICISRLSDQTEDWKKAHNLAANYHLNVFKVSQKIGVQKIAASYAELRHHLYEAGRIDELNQSSDRVIKFALSHIDKPAQSKIPENTETLEERIALISAIPDVQRPKGLEYHLALCLKHRNIGDDYKNALHYARRAVGHRAYYAVWLLLLELEYALNGTAAMLAAQEEALKFLSNGSNSFSIYHRSAQILRDDDKLNKAIDVLEKGINTSGVTCLSSLVNLCSKYMAQAGRSQEAIRVIELIIDTKDIPEVATLYKRCANLMANNNRIEDAIFLLKKGINIPEMTMVHSLYLLCSDLTRRIGKTQEAVNLLREGINNAKVIDPVRLYRKCAELLVSSRQTEEAVSLIKEGIANKSIKEPVKLYIYLAELMEKTGDAEGGVVMLKSALASPAISHNTILYLSCAKILLHLKKLDDAIDVLNSGISLPKLKEQRQLFQMCSELLGMQGRFNEGIEVLKKGISNPLIDNKFTLYHACSKLMVKAERIDDAIDILNDGINAPAVKNKTVLIQACAKLLAKANRYDEAINLLEQSIKLPGITGLAPVYQTCANILTKDGRASDAIRLLKHAIGGPKIGNLVSLYNLCVNLMMEEGLYGDAEALSKEGISIYPKDMNLKDFYNRVKVRTEV